MLNNISWASYVYAITIIVIIYYALVLIFYYRNDLSYLLRKNANRSRSVQTNFYPGKVENDLEKNKDLLIDYGQDDSIGPLLSNLQALIKNGAARNFPREELLLSLQLKLQQDAALKDSIHKDNISNFIISECKNYCSIHLSGDEVSALWIK